MKDKIAKFGSKKYRNIEVWERIDSKVAIFFGGSLGKYKGGITALEVSNNSRLV